MVSIELALTQGLLAGFASKTTISKQNRGGIQMVSSHFEAGTTIYHDEWFPGSNGGGQELAMAGEKGFTRLYAGGIIDAKVLANLGTSEKDVMGELSRRLIVSGSKTRLFHNYSPKDYGLWGYSYNILNQVPEVELTIAKETITYKGTLAFIHVFLLSPLK